MMIHAGDLVRIIQGTATHAGRLGLVAYVYPSGNLSVTFTSPAVVFRRCDVAAVCHPGMPEHEAGAACHVCDERTQDARDEAARNEAAAAWDEREDEA